MKKLILMLAFMGMTVVSYSQSKNNFDVRQEEMTQEFEDSTMIHKIMKVLKMVESRNDHKAVSPDNSYYGILQIGKVCIKEVNRLS